MTTNDPGAEAPAPCFRPVEQTRDTKTADLVAAQIRAAIVRGELTSGDLLPAEPKLIDQFAVSRPTIREAIRILESEDLLVVLRGARGGARVLKPTADLVSRAAGVTLQAQVEAEYALGEDVVALSAALAEFHRILLEQSGSCTLALVGAVLQSLVERHQALVEARFGETRAETRAKLMQIVVAAQQKLVDLVGDGEAEEAERHWRRHMEAARGFWLAGDEAAVVNLIG